MYYPIIRTKQFNLLALQLLIKENLLSETLIPVFEPIKDAKILSKTLELFDEAGHFYYVIENPSVGQYGKISDKLYPIKTESPFYKRAFFTEKKLFLEDLLVTETIFPTGEKEIFLADYYNKNQGEDAFFSDDHLYFKEDGFMGFSDYSIDGSFYTDKGYPEKVMTLPVVYLDPFNNFRIKYFQSDNNEGFGKVNEKFLSCGKKLCTWMDKYQGVTYFSPFLKEVYESVEQKHFPGAGTVKKWLLAHHFATYYYYERHHGEKKVQRY